MAAAGAAPAGSVAGARVLRGGISNARPLAPAGPKSYPAGAILGAEKRGIWPTRCRRSRRGPDDELEQLARYHEREGRARLRGAALAVLVDELRALRDGLAMRVRADLLLADVLRALRWPEGAIAAALGDRAGAGRRDG